MRINLAFKVQNGQIIPVKSKTDVKSKPNVDFEKILLEKVKRQPSVKISAHAIDRMDKRQIELDEKDMEKINDAFEALEKKGGRESLLLYKDAAFIASVQNRTIITAMKSSEMESVTNIDSAISIK
ncbi:MAG TPA: hypothetical protein DCG38_06215 [Eubacteriaceae bacterium]|nr:hypothetical protein [Eubacteriaceae bacterium]